MAFETERGHLISVARDLGVELRLSSLQVWTQTCFAQILKETETYPDGTMRNVLWRWLEAVSRDEGIGEWPARATAQAFWRVWSARMFYPVESPLKACSAAVREHLKGMAETSLIPRSATEQEPVGGRVAWVPLDRWFEQPLHPVWRARYDDANRQLREHSDDRYDMLRQLAFGHLQNVSEPAHSSAYKWLRLVWVMGLWEAWDEAPAVWLPLLGVIERGYLPVGLSADGRSFLVASQVLP
jgi:hypothetical protein